MKKTILLLSLSILPFISMAQQAQKTRCQSNPEYRQFDFWVGEWEVKNPQDQVAGNSKIELIIGDCVIFENWTSANPAYSGKSFNYYNVLTGTWQQKWIDNQGIPIEFEGTFDAEAKTMNYKGNGVGQGGVKLNYKLTFFHLTDDHVRQLWEQSSDEGETWTIIFDGHYRRK